MISLATVAAFVVDEGLGAPIFAAHRSRRFNTEFIAAGVLAVAARAGRRRAARRRAAPAHAVGAGGGGAMNDFVDAFTFIGDNPSPAARQDASSTSCSAASAIGDRRS